jgi:hypothetical protein
MNDMSFTSRDAARTRFRGTRFAYDRSEVDAFHREVVVALAEYEAALEEAEAKLTRLNRSNRGLVRAGRGEADAQKAATPMVPAVADDPLADFHRWRADKAAQFEVAATLAAAHEEAAMIRATTAARAAHEIEQLTAGARTEARAITRRAAALAADTEEAARVRAGEILDDSDRGTDWDPAVGAAEMQVLSERIVRLRGSIADVQGRLEALAGEEDAREVGGEIIDLRDTPDESAPESHRKRRRPKVGAMADAQVTAEALEAKMTELKRRLGSG